MSHSNFYFIALKPSLPEELRTRAIQGKLLAPSNLEAIVKPVYLPLSFQFNTDEDGVFGPASHRRLLELIKTTKCRWSLSYYYFPLLEELLPRDKYRWTEKEVFRSSAQGGNNANTKKKQSNGVELLIMNYDENGVKF